MPAVSTLVNSTVDSTQTQTGQYFMPSGLGFPGRGRWLTRLLWEQDTPSSILGPRTHRCAGGEWCNWKHARFWPGRVRVRALLPQRIFGDVRHQPVEHEWSCACLVSRMRRVRLPSPALIPALSLTNTGCALVCRDALQATPAEFDPPAVHDGRSARSAMG